VWAQSSAAPAVKRFPDHADAIAAIVQQLPLQEIICLSQSSSKGHCSDSSNHGEIKTSQREFKGGMKRKSPPAQQNSK
jgi:hypothetical protein